MYRALVHLDGSKHSIVVSNHNKVKNEWGDDEEDVFQSSIYKQAAKGLKEFHQFAHCRYLPKTKVTKTLGTYDYNIHPKAVTTYCIGSVVNIVADLPSGKIMHIV